METPNRHPWRRYLRLSLRSLLIVILVFGGWLGLMVHYAHVQREAVAAIERVGGEVWYDWQFKNGRFITNGTPRVPKWLVDRIGIDYFGDVVHVDLVGCGTDQLLARVGNLSRLEE